MTTRLLCWPRAWPAGRSRTPAGWSRCTRAGRLRLGCRGPLRPGLAHGGGPAPPGRSTNSRSSTSSSIQAITPPRLFPAASSCIQPDSGARHLVRQPLLDRPKGGTVASATRSPRQRDGGVRGRGEQLAWPRRSLAVIHPRCCHILVGQRVSGHHHLAERDGAVAGDRHQRRTLPSRSDETPFLHPARDPGPGLAGRWRPSTSSGRVSSPRSAALSASARLSAGPGSAETTRVV